MVEAIATMLDVRAEWVLYRGEPVTPIEQDQMVREVERLTRIRLADAAADLELARQYVPREDRICRRQGCGRRVLRKKKAYCDDPTCKRLVRQEARRKSYAAELAKPGGKEALAAQKRVITQKVRERYKKAGLTSQGKPRKNKIPLTP